MFRLLQLSGLLLASGVVLTLLSERFAFAVSRVLEAAFDRAEYRLALRSRRRKARLNHTHDGGAVVDQEQTTT